MQINFRPFAVCAVIVVSSFLFFASCGSDSANVVPPVVPPVDPSIAPIAVASYEPSIVHPGDNVNLIGTASSGSDSATSQPCGYLWTQVEGAKVEIVNSSSSIASFVAPSDGSALKFELIVTDCSGVNSVPVYVEIQIVHSAESAVYVSVATGDDGEARDGSYANPVKSIRRGLELVLEKSADVVYVMPGDYQESINIPSGISLIGGLLSVSDGDTHVFAEVDGPVTRIIAASLDVPAVSIVDAKAVGMRGFTVTAEGQSLAAKLFEVSSSEDVILANNYFEAFMELTAECSGLSIAGSKNVTLDSSAFKYNGQCAGFAAVDIDSSEGVVISSKERASALNLTGNSQRIVAIEAKNSTRISVNGVEILMAASSADASSIVCGVAADSVSGFVFEKNSITISGGAQSDGLHFECSSSPTDVRVFGNRIAGSSGAISMSGITAYCKADGGKFDISSNIINLLPTGNSPVAVNGVDSSFLFRKSDISLINNVVMMPVQTTSDKANKSGFHVTRYAAASNVKIYNNTLLVTGKTGYLSGIYSDVTESPLDARNNLIVVFGSNQSNAVFALKKECSTKQCINGIKGNVLNRLFFNKDVKLTYYYDTKETESFSSMPGGNANAAFTPDYFDSVTGELKSSYQQMAIDAGIPVEGVTVDVVENTRDAKPDAGAYEY